MSKLFFAQMSVLTLVMGLMGCSNSDDNVNSLSTSSADLMVQQIGESTVSMDESTGSSSGSLRRSHVLEAACSTVDFGVCGAITSGTMVKDFNGCTLAGGLISVSGTVTLTYSGSGSSTCTIPGVGDSVNSIPAFKTTLAGNNGSYVVSPVSTGQTLTRTASSTFSFNNTGIRRVYTAGSSSTTTVADLTTATTAPISVSGTTRTGRVVNGGSLQVTDNITNEVCTVSPNNVTWTTSSCSCPTSGTWSGSCSTGNAISVVFTSTCGRVDVMYGAASKTAVVERCN